MRQRNRREFLQVVGAGSVALLGGSSLHAHDGVPQAAELRDLRARLQAAHDRIRTAHLQGKSEIIEIDPERQSKLEETSWVFEGQFEIFHRPDGYRLIEKKGDVTITEVSDGKRFVRRVQPPDRSVPPRVLYDGPENQEWHPRNTLNRFLPVPRDAPAYDQGTAEIHGKHCRIVAQDALLFYVDEDVPAVVRLEVFSSAETLATKVDFYDFEEIVTGVFFPRRSIVTHYHPSTEAVQVQVDFEVIQINQDLPAHYFSFEEDPLAGGER